jgi:murein DD-endopeptidase MepM/ murein hydrolase activator NlpD
VSTRADRPRGHAGRHRAPKRTARLPRALSPGFALPTLAAATLVATASGAVVAEAKAPLTLDLTGQQTALAKSQAETNEAYGMDLALRRQDAGLQTAALAGRTEAQQRAARAAKRDAEAKAKAEALAHRWVRPIGIWKYTSSYGIRWGRMHEGIDLAAPTGTPLMAMSSGTVLQAGWENGLGNKVAIQYWDGSVTWYGHMSRISVVKGQKVSPGQVVGAVGNTGHSFGSHLHLEVHRTPARASVTNPVPWLTLHGLW